MENLWIAGDAGVWEKILASAQGKIAALGAVQGLFQKITNKNQASSKKQSRRSVFKLPCGNYIIASCSSDEDLQYVDVSKSQRKQSKR